MLWCIRKKALRKLCLLMRSEHLSDVRIQELQQDSCYDEPTFKRSNAGFENGNQLFMFFPEQYKVKLLRGKNVLDLGCHCGGPGVYYAHMGADKVFGLDIVYRRVNEGRKFSLSKNAKNAFFIQGDAEAIPFVNESFDFITARDFFEHVDSPEKALQESYRVLKKGGLMILVFPPFYHPWGYHITSITRFPWLHVFFSPSEIIDVCREISLEHFGSVRFVPPLPIINKGKKRFAHVNGITIKRFKKIINSSSFSIRYYRLVPLLSSSLFLRDNPNKLQLLRKFKPFFDCLPSIPAIKEFFTAKVVYILEKPE